MDASIDIEELYAEVNRCLSPEQRIQKDDPLFTAIVLNKVILGRHVRFLQKMLDEALQEMRKAAEQQTDSAATIADRVIIRAANEVERQMTTAATHWNEQLRRDVASSETSMRRATWYAWASAILIFITACAAVGSYMGNVALRVMHHPQSRHR